MPREFENLAKEVAASSKEVSDKLVDMAAAAELADKAIGAMSATQASAAKILKDFAKATLTVSKNADASEKKTKKSAKATNGAAAATKKVKKGAKDASNALNDLGDSADNLSDEMEEVSTFTGLVVKKFKDGQKEAKDFAKSLGISGGKAMVAGVALVYLSKKADDLVDSYKDAAKSLAKFNVMAAKSGQAIMGIDTAGLEDLRHELALSREEAGDFYDVLQRGSVSGVAPIEKLAGAAKKLREAFGGDQTKLVEEYVDLLESIPTLDTDFSVTASMDDRAASLFAIAKQGKIKTLIELQRAGIVGADLSVTSPEDVELLNSSQKAEKIQEDIKDFLVSKMFPSWGGHLGNIAKGILALTTAFGGAITILGFMKGLNALQLAAQKTQVVSQGQTTAAIYATSATKVPGVGVSSVIGGGGAAKAAGAAGTAAVVGGRLAKVSSAVGKASKAIGGKLTIGAIAAALSFGALEMGAEHLQKKFEESGDKSKAAMAGMTAKVAKAGGTIAGWTASGAVFGSIIPGLGTGVGAAIGAVGGLVKSVWDWKKAGDKEAESNRDIIEAQDKLFDAELAFAESIQAVDKIFENQKYLLNDLNREIASVEFGNIAQFGASVADYESAVDRAATVTRKKFDDVAKALEEQRATIKSKGMTPELESTALANLRKKELETLETYVSELDGIIQQIPESREVTAGLELGKSKMEMASFTEDAGKYATEAAAITRASLDRRIALQRKAVDVWEKQYDEIIEMQVEAAKAAAFERGAGARESVAEGERIRNEMTRTKETHKQAKFEEMKSSYAKEALEVINEVTQKRMEEVDIQRGMVDTAQDIAEQFDGSAAAISGFLAQGLALEQQTLAIFQQRAAESRKLSGNSVETRKLELEVVKQQAQVRKIELESVRKIVELREREIATVEEGLDAELDYLSYMGANFSRMLDIQGKMVESARERYQLAQDEVAVLQAKGVTGQRLLEAETKARKAWFDMQKRSVGVQKDIMEKILGSAIGEIRGEFGARIGRKRMAAAMGVENTRVFNRAGMPMAAPSGGVLTIAQRSIMRQLQGLGDEAPKRLSIEEQMQQELRGTNEKTDLVAKHTESTADAVMNMNARASSRGSLFTHDEGAHSYLAGILTAVTAMAEGTGKGAEETSNVKDAIEKARDDARRDSDKAEKKLDEVKKVQESSVERESGTLPVRLSAEQISLANSIASGDNVAVAKGLEQIVNFEDAHRKRQDDFRRTHFKGTAGMGRLEGKGSASQFGRVKVTGRLEGKGPARFLGKGAGPGIIGRGFARPDLRVQHAGAMNRSGMARGVGAEGSLLSDKAKGFRETYFGEKWGGGIIAGGMADADLAASEAFNRMANAGVAAQNRAGQNAWESGSGTGRWAGANAPIPGGGAMDMSERPGTTSAPAVAGGGGTQSGMASTMKIEGTLTINLGSLMSTMGTLVASVINTPDVRKSMDKANVGIKN